MDPDRVTEPPLERRLPLTAVVKTLLAAAILIAAGYGLARYFDRQEQHEVANTDVDKLVVALRDNRNRLEVYKMAGTVTTKRQTTGGIGDILTGEITVKQPWALSYFVDMGDVGLDDYVWDAATRTLLVRAPPATADTPNIDESRQVVAYQGLLFTREMQSRLRQGVAIGARQQAAAEADKPANRAAADAAARKAIAQNLAGPLRAAGLGDVTVVVRGPADGARDGERWDVSRSIADVLEQRSAR